MGKTKVLAPLVSFSRADGEHISIVVFLDSQFQPGTADLRKLLATLGRMVLPLTYERASHSVAALEEAQKLLDFARRGGHVVVTRPRDLHCLSMLPIMDLETLKQRRKKFATRVKLREAENKSPPEAAELVAVLFRRG